MLRPDGRLASYTAVSAPTVYRGDRLPAELRGNVFVVDPAANVVSRITIHDDGAKLVARKAYEHTEFLTSTDERFRPVYLSNAPDGTLYLVDMYHGIIQHRDYITEYLRDQILSRKLRGALSATGASTASCMTRRSRGAQAGAVATADAGAARRAPRRIPMAGGVTRRSGCSSNAAMCRSLRRLKKLAASRTGRDVCGCTRCGRSMGSTALDIELVTTALPIPLATCARRPSACRSDGCPSPAAIQAAVLRLRDDRDWEVRGQLAASLGGCRPASREAALAGMLESMAPTR